MKSSKYINNLVEFGILYGCLFLIEVIFKLISKMNIFTWEMLRIFIGTGIISLVFSLIGLFIKKSIRRIIFILLIIILSFYALLQAGFVNYLGVYLSFLTSSQAGAVKDYVGDYINSFKWYYYLILLVNVIIITYYVLVSKKIDKKIEFNRNEIVSSIKGKKKKALKEGELINKDVKIKKVLGISSVILIVLLSGLYYLTLVLPFMQNKLQMVDNKSLFNYPSMPNVAVNQFGIIGYGLIDIKGLIIPVADASNNIAFEEEEEVITDQPREIDDTVWESILANETNSNYKTLSEYYLSKSITPKNEMTGLFKDKNLIVIQMESTNNLLLMEEYFPNFNKLYKEGWSWENSYSPRNSCSTGNNEMSGMVSLFTENLSCTANLYYKNIYPESIFNLFNNAGYITSSYHNYTDQYYLRHYIHPNMGSMNYYGVTDLGIPYSNLYKEWPSDVDLVEKSFDIYSDDERFMVWLTTVSAHQPYGYSSTLGDKHLDLFKDLDVDMSVKRYLSKLKEFDLSIGRLIELLESKDLLDDTVIVFFADHYPYGVTTNNLQKLFTEDLTKYNNVDRTPFLIYNSTITSHSYDDYTSYMNILPTIANLFDLDYDPRYYSGGDLFADNYEDRVVFADGSWLDDKAYYNATLGTVDYFSVDVYTDEEIMSINKKISNNIKMSNLAIKTDYFNYLYKEFDKYKSS